MEKRTGLKNISLRMAAVLLILVMLSFCLLSGMLARYRSVASGNDSATVALIDVSGEGTYSSPEIIFENMIPGETKSYDFKIKSNSEVTLKCSAVLESTENLPLSFKLKQGEDEVSLDALCDFPIGAGEESFTLYATWDEDIKAYEYTDEIDAIRIIVTAEQID